MGATRGNRVSDVGSVGGLEEDAGAASSPTTSAPFVRDRHHLKMALFLRNNKRKGIMLKREPRLKKQQDHMSVAFHLIRVQTERCLSSRENSDLSFLKIAPSGLARFACRGAKMDGMRINVDARKRKEKMYPTILVSTDHARSMTRYDTHPLRLE